MSHPIEGDKPLEQPKVEQPGGPSQSEQIRKFDVQQGGQAHQVPHGIQAAVKRFLKGGEKDPEFKDDQGEYYKVVAKEVKGQKNTQQLTIEAFGSKPGKGVAPANSYSFEVKRRWDAGHHFIVFDVYSADGKQRYPDMSTQALQNIPNNLGELAKMDPGMAKKLHHEFLLGIAMKIMQESRKHAKMFSQAQENA